MGVCMVILKLRRDLKVMIAYIDKSLSSNALLRSCKSILQETLLASYIIKYTNRPIRQMNSPNLVSRDAFN